MTAGRRATRKPNANANADVDESARQAQELERLRRENERLRQENAEQKKRIADLERQLALRQQNSTTTSKPPSSDGLAGRQRERGRRIKSRRKPGGQPGHPGHSRPLVPAERVNATVDLIPDACQHCLRRLHARDEVGDPRRHQVTELPPIDAHITEYRCHRRRCRRCGKTTQAPLPDEIAGQFGPQLTALIAYLTVVCRLPRLVVQRLLEGALRAPPRQQMRPPSVRTAPSVLPSNTVVHAHIMAALTNGINKSPWGAPVEDKDLTGAANSSGVRSVIPSGYILRAVPTSLESDPAYICEFRGRPRKR